MGARKEIIELCLKIEAPEPFRVFMAEKVEHARRPFKLLLEKSLKVFGDKAVGRPVGNIPAFPALPVKPQGGARVLGQVNGMAADGVQRFTTEQAVGADGD